MILPKIDTNNSKTKVTGNHLPQALNTFITNIRHDITNQTHKKTRRNNITKAENKALNDLQERKYIIIKPADKGSAVVIMDSDHFISEALRQLGNTSHDMVLDNDPTLDYQAKVCEIVSEMRASGLISEGNEEYLIIDNPVPGRFYLLPKIHMYKYGNPGRPIVSANGTSNRKNFRMYRLSPKIVTIIRERHHRLLKQIGTPNINFQRHCPNRHGCHITL